MTSEDVRLLADEVFRPLLGPVGFESAEVEEGEDHTGDGAFFVKVHFKSGSQTAEGRVYNEALWNLSSAPQMRGERGFAHLLWSYVEDPGDQPDPDPDDGDSP